MMMVYLRGSPETLQMDNVWHIFQFKIPSRKKNWFESICLGKKRGNMSKIEEIVEHFVIYCFFGFAQASMVIY